MENSAPAPALNRPASPAGPRLRLLAGAVLFSTGGAAIKMTSLGAFQVACFRSAVAALALLFLFPRERLHWTRRAWMVGAAYAATMVLFVNANKLTTSANTIFLQSAAPLYILLLGPWLLHEPIRRRDLAFLGALAAGLALFFIGTEPPLQTAPSPLLGNALAALSGVGWALTIVGLRWTARAEGGAAGTAAAGTVAGNIMACLFCLPGAFPLGATGPSDWLAVVYLGVFQIGLAYVLVTQAMRRVPALEASLYLMVEPVLNPVWTWLLLGERPGPWSLAGGAIILLATALKTAVDSRS